MKKPVSVVLCAFVFFSSLSAVAQSKKKTAAQPAAEAAPAGSPAPGAENSDKLDVSELEQKYWSPKDTDFNVVQNRTYTKAKRFALSAQAGSLINDTYAQSLEMGLTANYYFNERYGVELSYIKSAAKEKKIINAFKDRYATTPSYNLPDSYIGASFNFVPLYAKMSLLDKHILYFDLSIAPGVGLQSYTQKKWNGDIEKSSPAVSIDVTQHVFFSRNFAFRVDFKNRWWKEEVREYFGGTNDNNNNFQVDRVLSNDLSNTTELLFGLTFFF